MDQLVYDLRFALRNLNRNRGLSMIIVVTLAVGIACTTAMFSVVRGMLLRPLPWPESERLAVIWNLPSRSADELELSVPEIRDLQELVPGIEVGAYRSDSHTVFFEDRTQTYASRRVTLGGFELLGARPVLGRTFSEDDFAAEAADTVMLSYELWQRVFAGDPAVLGRKLDVEGRESEVIGVMPPDFPMPLDMVWGERPQLWSGLALEHYERWPRQTRMFSCVARLRDGVTLERAHTELALAMEEMRRRHPEYYEAGWRMRLAPVEEEVLGDVRPAVLMLFGAVFFVLMIACANVAHLLLAHNDSRAAEIALRGALGARRSRLVRQLMFENLVLALSGGALGAFGTHGAVQALLALQPGNLPRIENVAVDSTVLLFGLAASVVTAVGFGLAPALKAAGVHIKSALHQGRGTVGGLRGRSGRRWLMVGEVALAGVLLAGAALLVESLKHLGDADLGFEPRNLVVASVSLPRGYSRSHDVPQFWDRLRAEAEQVPGVERATTLTMVPFYSGVMSRDFEIEDAVAGRRPVPRVSIDRAGPGIVETMGLRLLRGRDLAEQDREGAQLAALVNETLAGYLGPDVLGRRLRLAKPDLAGEEAEDMPWVTVVGVVADVAHGSVGEAASPRIVLPYRQLPEIGHWRYTTFMWLALRTRGDATGAVEGVRGVLRQIDPRVPVTTTLVLEEHVSGSVLARYRFAAFVLSIFAAVALGLALVGIYGLLSYLVNLGRREVGVRLALGAQRGEIHRQVSRQGLTLTLGGLALGLPAALALSGLLGSLLYGVAPTDLRSYAVTAALLVMVGFAASYLPARRATEVNPIEVLRSE